MTVVALTLREPQALQVRGAWGCLEERLGLWGAQRSLFPHITLLGCEGVEGPRLQAILEDFSQSTAPFVLRTAGLGLFLKPKPILHAPVIRTPHFSDLHRRLWTSATALGGQLFDLYSPERWLPHLTLAMGDLTHSNLLEAIGILAELEAELTIEATNLTIFEWIGPCWEPRERYPLVGDLRPRGSDPARLAPLRLAAGMGAPSIPQPGGIR